MIPWRPTPPHLACVLPALKSALVVALMVAMGALLGCADDTFDSQGSAPSPVDLGTAPISAYAGSVGPDASSYYSVTVSDLTTYNISLFQLTSDADLAVFQDAGFSISFCVSTNSGAANESCSDTTSGITMLYIQIKPYSDTGTDFLLTVQGG